MTYTEALMAFSSELKERTKPYEELHFFYQQVEKTLDFNPKADDRFLNFYTGVLEEELKFLKEGSDLGMPSTSCIALTKRYVIFSLPQ